MEAPSARKKAPGSMSRRDRERMLVQKEAHKRQQAGQVRRWIEEFDLNGTGRLERDELASLLHHLHPEVGAPTPEALDILIEKATEVRTYTMHLQGNKNGAIGPDAVLSVVTGYGMYLLASAAFDKRAAAQGGGVVSLGDLPAIMKELGKADGSDIEGSDVDFVMDCAASSLHGLDSASNISRDDLMPSLAAWKIAELEQVDEGGAGGETGAAGMAASALVDAGDAADDDRGAGAASNEGNDGGAAAGARAVPKAEDIADEPVDVGSSSHSGGRALPSKRSKSACIVS